MNSRLRKYIRESQKLVGIQKAYGLNYTKESPAPVTSYYIPYVYTTPSMVVKPTEYIQMNNLADMASNILDGVKINPENGVSGAFILNTDNWKFFEQPAAIFLNGVYIYSINSLLDFTSTDISRIELCSTIRIKGNIQFPGILSINTYKKYNFETLLPGSIIFIWIIFFRKRFIIRQYTIRSSIMTHSLNSGNYYTGIQT